MSGPTPYREPDETMSLKDEVRKLNTTIEFLEGDLSLSKKEADIYREKVVANMDFMIYFKAFISCVVFLPLINGYLHNVVSPSMFIGLMVTSIGFTVCMFLMLASKAGM